MTTKQITKLYDRARMTADDDLERDCLAALDGDAAAQDRLAARVARERAAKNAHKSAHRA